MVALAHSLDLFLLKKKNKQKTYNGIMQKADTAPLQSLVNNIQKNITITTEYPCAAKKCRLIARQRWKLSKNTSKGKFTRHCNPDDWGEIRIIWIKLCKDQVCGSLREWGICSEKTFSYRTSTFLILIFDCASTSINNTVEEINTQEFHLANYSFSQRCKNSEFYISHYLPLLLFWRYKSVYEQ